MPISEILSDGKVRIYNNKTGQVAEVLPSELSKYSPKLVGEYEKLRTQANKDFLSKSEKNTNAALSQLNVLIKSQDPEKGQDPKSTAWKYINSLEKTARKKGVDMATLWNVYSSLPTQEKVNNEGQLGNVLRGIVNKF